MPNEADIKRDIVKAIRDEGGYGRRIEDQFSVGMPDLVLIPARSWVFFAEVKMITGEAKFGCTPRQLEECRRIAEVHGHAIPVLLGYGRNTKRIYACEPAAQTYAKDALCSTEKPWQVGELLNCYAERIFAREGLARLARPVT